MDTASSRRNILAAAGLVAGTATLSSTAQAAGDPATSPLKETAIDPITSAPSAEPLLPLADEATPPISSAEFARSGAEGSGWQAAVQKIVGELSPTTDGKAFSQLQKNFRRIDYGFAFSAEANDKDFSFLHVEPLIDQAADLLDRGLRDRGTFDDLSVKFFDLVLELSEYAELDRIHIEEEQRGVYEIPYKQSRGEREGERATEASARTAAATMAAYRTNYLTNAKLNEESGSVQLAAVTGPIPPYYWTGQTFQQFGSLNWNGTTKLVYEHAKDAAFHSSWFNLKNLDYTTYTQLQNSRYAESAAKARNEGWTAKANWDAANSGFQKRRTMVARRYQDIKVQSVTDDDGILNYSKRLPALRKRFQQDFRNALARLFVIKDGLKQLYDYDAPFPADPSAVDYFDQCLIWTRDAIQWVIRFSRKEQSVILPVSLRRRVGEAAWKNGLAARSWIVDIDDTVLPNMKHVRLRGLSVFTEEDENDERIWSLDLKVPKKGTFYHLSGPPIQVDQSIVPAIKFGRVGTRFATREPDVLGISALHNASPIGSWSVKVVNKYPSTADYDEIDDIYLDLHLAFRAAP